MIDCQTIQSKQHLPVTTFKMRLVCFIRFPTGKSRKIDLIFLKIFDFFPINNI